MRTLAFLVLLTNAYGATLEESFVSGNAQNYFAEKIKSEMVTESMDRPIFKNVEDIFKVIINDSMKKLNSQKPFRFMQDSINIKFKGETYAMKIGKHLKPDNYVFLTDNLKTEIQEFLGWPEELRDSRNNFLRRPQNEFSKRLAFINNYVSVHLDEAREEYLFTIYPEFSFIKFGDNESEASVYVYMQGAWVDIIVSRLGSEWRIVSFEEQGVE